MEYQVGGCLPPQSDSYMERQADRVLYEALLAGEFCYVLNSRQMGKSTLRSRISDRLKSSGVICALVDLQDIGKELDSAEQWYAGVVQCLIDDLSLPLELRDWWREHDLLSPVQRLHRFIQQEIVQQSDRPIVIFVDEIDSILGLSFQKQNGDFELDPDLDSSNRETNLDSDREQDSEFDRTSKRTILLDDFLVLIRSFHLRPKQNRKVTFALFGVGTPNSLIQDKNRTPFNIGRPIALEGFSFEEARGLAQGLADRAVQPEVLLRQILAWTGGQPFLTQKLCDLAQQETGLVLAGQEAEWVAELVQRQIVTNWEFQDQPVHLGTIRDRLLGQEESRAGRLLGIYQTILQQGSVAAATVDAEQAELRLSGLVVNRRGRLEVFNPIYQQVFNFDWVSQELAKLRDPFYAEAFSAWMQSGKRDDSRLLRGQALQKALAWKAGKRLSDQDEEFLDASQQNELEVEQQAKQILEKANRRAIKRIRIGAILMVVALIVAVGASFFAQQQLQTAALANVRVSSANSATLFLSGQQFSGLLESLKAGQQLKKLDRAIWQQENTEAHVVAALYRGNTEVNERNTFSGHQREVSSVSFSPDGTTIASGSIDGTIKLWNAATGAEIRTLSDHKGIVNSVSFSPDGQTIASAGNAIVKLWDVKTGQELHTLSGYEGGVSSIAFSPNGKMIISSGGYENKVKVWDVGTGQELLSLSGHEGGVIDVNFSPNGKVIASSGKDSNVKLWDAETGQELHILSGHQAFVVSVSFSPDSRIIASSSIDSTIKLWDVDSGRLLVTLSRHQGWVNDISFSPDGQVFASGSDDNTVRLWDVETGLELHSMIGHRGPIKSISFSPDGKTIASGSSDKTIKLWDVTTGEASHTLSGHLNTVWSVSFSPDGKTIASGSEDKTAKLWDVASGQELHILSGHQDIVGSISFSPDGKTIVSGSGDGTIKMWDATTGEELRTLSGHLNTVWSVSFSPDGKTIASGSEDKTAKLWNVATGEELRTLSGHQDIVRSISFSPNGKTIVSGSGDGAIKMWDATTGKELRTLSRHQDIVRSISFSPDGKMIMSGSGDGTIKMWDVATGKELRTFSGLPNTVWSVSFSPDGKTIVSGSGDGTIKMWDVATGQELLTLSGQELLTLFSYQGVVLSVSFSPDGKTIASGSSDGTIKLWTWDFDKLMASGCNWISAYLITHPEDEYLCEGYR